jgi:hypothetical protein
VRRLAFLLALIASPLAAQSDYSHTIGRIGNVAFINRHPNCNPFTAAFDPMWLHNQGWTMPRLGWTVMDAGLNLGIVYALRKLHVPTAIGAQPLMWGPHVGQAARDLSATGKYEGNAPDWAYDAWNRSAPIWLLNADSSNRKRRALTWIAGDVALFCFARP